MIKQSLAVGFLICFVLFVNSCATFKKPATLNDSPILERAQTKEEHGIRVSASVLGDGEARQIFGIDLVRKKIQTVWIEVEKNADANGALYDYLLSFNFPIPRPVAPGSNASGYIFTSWKKGIKVIDVDLLGDNLSQHFTFFVPNPDSSISWRKILLNS